MLSNWEELENRLFYSKSCCDSPSTLPALVGPPFGAKHQPGVSTLIAILLSCSVSKPFLQSSVTNPSLPPRDVHGPMEKEHSFLTGFIPIAHLPFKNQSKVQSKPRLSLLLQQSPGHAGHHPPTRAHTHTNGELLRHSRLRKMSWDQGQISKEIPETSWPRRFSGGLPGNCLPRILSWKPTFS